MDSEHIAKALETSRVSDTMSEEMREKDMMVRLEARVAAESAIREDFAKSLDGDSELPADFDRAVQFVSRYLYETGQPDSDMNDIGRHLGEKIDWIKLHEKVLPEPEKSWLPEDGQATDLVIDLIRRGSLLGIKDIQPAFGVMADSDRQWEALDEPGDKYNKFGFRISPRHLT